MFAGGELLLRLERFSCEQMKRRGKILAGLHKPGLRGFQDQLLTRLAQIENLRRMTGRFPLLLSLRSTLLLTLIFIGGLASKAHAGGRSSFFTVRGGVGDRFSLVIGETAVLPNVKYAIPPTRRPGW